jgi:NAD dependent epimerase/dehydratase family enzyme
MLRVLVSGATGLVGQALLSALDERGDTVHALSRREPEAVDTGASGAERLRYFQWNGLEPPEAALQEVDVVVHLAGEPIFGGIPTRRRMERMVASRVESTRSLIAGIAARIILSRRGGALAAMRLPFDYNLGGRLGNGRQWVPWVHLDDVIGAALLAIDGELDGPVNVVAPNPVTNRELTHEIAQRLDRPGFWIVPGFVLRTVLGEIADELLGSKHVAPTALERARYRFRYPELGPALADELP